MLTAPATHDMTAQAKSKNISFFLSLKYKKQNATADRSIRAIYAKENVATEDMKTPPKNERAIV